MNRRIVFVAAALLALATIVNAQQPLPPGKWWQRSEVVQELQLTNDQRERLDDIFRSAADGLIDAKASVEKLQVALGGELDRSQVRREEVLRITRELNTARGRLFEREIAMLIDMRGVLNEQQWTRMRERLDRGRDNRPDRMQDGRPGAGRPGPGPGRGGMRPPGGRRP